MSDYAPVTYTGNGSTKTYSITFSDYLKQSNVTVKVDGVLMTNGGPGTYDYTIDDATKRVTFTTAPVNGATILIERSTPTDLSTNEVEFSSGGDFSEVDMNDVVEQSLLIDQEAKYNRSQLEARISTLESATSIEPSATFDTLALLTSNTNAIADGKLVYLKGRYTEFDGGGGPPLICDRDDTSSVANNITIFVDAAGQRFKRSLTNGINILWAGMRPSTDGDESYASANVTAWNTLKTLLTATPNTVIIPKIGDQVFYYNADLQAAGDCTYILEGTLKKAADVNAVGFDVPTGVNNVTLRGTGAIHGNAQLTQPRAGGSGIRATNNNNFNILDRVQVYHCEDHAVNIRQAVNCKFDGLYVRNTYGSAKSGDSTSGVNMDGIHLYNPEKVAVVNCDIKSIDDSIAVTMLETYTNETKGVLIDNCILEPVKAENSNVSGDGSNELVIGAGIRVSQEGSETLCRLRDVTITNCTVIGGDSGMLLGATGYVGSLRFIERLTVSNMHFINIATDADMSLNRAISGGIFARCIKDSKFSDITFYNCGITSLNIDSSTNLEFRNIKSIGGTIDNANYPVNDEFERAHYLIRGSQGANDNILLEGLISDQADGAGLAIVHNGGGGKEITNVSIRNCVIDNPNQHGGSQDDHSPVYLVNISAGDILEYDIDIRNFTPSGSVVEVARSSSQILTQKYVPINIPSWHSDVYAAAGNWFTRIQLFAPTFTINNHFKGFTNVLQIDQGTTHITGTAQAGASDSITLASGETSLNDAFNGLTINITSGTGSGQSKSITDYVGSTKVATVDSAWSTPPDNTSVYEIEDAGGDGIYTVPLAGGNLDDRQVCAEFYIYIDSGSVKVIEDNTLSLVKDTITTTGEWLLVNKIWTPDQTSMRLGFLCGATPTTFYLGPIKVYEL